MHKPNLHINEKAWNKKWEQRDKKKKVKMKVSGGSVKKLSKIIINKA
ncbi:MAG: hypothetical protein BWY51_00577 [Parcubacteria group bacterium ADurb.Bin316]|nr:MAG: hypothetical protein BWY51_00577 [Parcubacteria group bacterium ADurb.Bin316]HOZ56150.1 hypothetical protein [bacterium]